MVGRVGEPSEGRYSCDRPCGLLAAPCPTWLSCGAGRVSLIRNACIGFAVDIVGRELRVDKVETGFLVWTSTVKGYRAVPAGPSPFAWEAASQPILQAMSEVMSRDNFFTVLALLWGQESMKNSTTPELRAENVTFMKSLGMSIVLLQVTWTEVEPSQNVRAREPASHSRHDRSTFGRWRPLQTTVWCRAVGGVIERCVEWAHILLELMLILRRLQALASTTRRPPLVLDRRTVRSHLCPNEA